MSDTRMLAHLFRRRRVAEWTTVWTAEWSVRRDDVMRLAGALSARVRTL